MRRPDLFPSKDLDPAEENYWPSEPETGALSVGIKKAATMLRSRSYHGLYGSYFSCRSPLKVKDLSKASGRCD